MIVSRWPQRPPFSRRTRRSSWTAHPFGPSRSRSGKPLRRSCSGTDSISTPGVRTGAETEWEGRMRPVVEFDQYSTEYARNWIGKTTICLRITRSPGLRRMAGSGSSRVTVTARKSPLTGRPSRPRTTSTAPATAARASCCPRTRFNSRSANPPPLKCLDIHRIEMPFVSYQNAPKMGLHYPPQRG